jgi:hypothetical protein
VCDTPAEVATPTRIELVFQFSTPWIEFFPVKR